MADHTNPTNQRVDRVSISSEPHDRYTTTHPCHDDEDIDPPGIPVLYDSPIGRVLLKSIRVYTVRCPECGGVARYDERPEPVCEDCGCVCIGDHRDTDPWIVRDAKTAGRTNKKSTLTPV